MPNKHEQNIQCFSKSIRETVLTGQQGEENRTGFKLPCTSNLPIDCSQGAVHSTTINKVFQALKTNS